MTREQWLASAEALLDLDAKGALVPHGIGGHARTLLEEAARHLSATVPAGDGELVVARLHRKDGLGPVIEKLDAAWGVGTGLFDLHAVKVANADGSPVLAALSGDTL